MAIWGMGVMVGPIVGPALGGYLTECYNWRWVFYINVPLGIIACLGIIFFLPDSKKEKNYVDFMMNIYQGFQGKKLHALYKRGTLIPAKARYLLMHTTWRLRIRWPIAPTPP